jgi:hypothetical protein
VNLEHVFAKATTVVDNLGYPVTVAGGSHWLADDPLVAERPDLFTKDCRYGLAYSGDPPECLSIPPEGEDQELPLGRRPRSTASARR